MNWKSTGSPHQLLVNNTLVTKAFDVAEEMKNYFYTKIINLRSAINCIVWTPESCQTIMTNKRCRLDLQFPTK